jgi:Flp pilus assembly protein TadG
MGIRAKSRGQALILVTLALIPMFAVMGLAVDLGWSFFVRKQAQAAADAAALSAVQEAVARIGTSGDVSGFSCASGAAGTGAGAVECQPNMTACGSVTTTSNLYNGCQYAKANGFDWAASDRSVTVRSYDHTVQPDTAPNVTLISYWVTVRATERVPQLFAYTMGFTQSTVSAVATAAIVGSIVPGSFYGMNQAGDCQNLAGTLNCGLDLTLATGKGKTACPSIPGLQGNLCAPNGIVLASSCNSVQAGVCSQAYAGDASGAGVVASSLTVMGTALSHGLTTGGPWQTPSGGTLTPNYSTSQALFKDPTSPNPQPPLQATGTLPSCGVSNSTPMTGTLGAYQYYHYTTTNAGGPIPDGQPITISGNATFAIGGTCPGVVSGSPQSAQFPTYVFYGGLVQDGTVNLGPGQYVMAGVASNAANATVFSSTQGSTTGNSTTGTMFIFTDGDYPGLTSQRLTLPNAASMPTLYQGGLYFKNADIDMTGLVNSAVGSSNLPPSMNKYSGIVWWQDRRNSFVEYNKAPSAACTGCTIDDGSVAYCYNCALGKQTAAMMAENHVTDTSPGVTVDPGNGILTLRGVYYQPRGAFLTLVHGTGSGQQPLMVVTGALNETSGDDRMLLAGPTNPLIRYRASLIR